jgi:hypothetical protein
MISRQRRLFASLLIGLFALCTGCSSALNAVDNAINELKQGNKTFEDMKNILGDTKDKIDKGLYKDQVDALLGRVSGVAQLGVQGTVDFTRTRAIEDLESIKRSILRQPPIDRVPILTNAESPKIDFSSVSRSTLTVIGWNLDVAQKNPDKYKVVVKNTKEPERLIDRAYVPFQGQYAVTFNVSNSGMTFKPYDVKLVFEGFDPLFEIAIINAIPPPPEKILSVTGNIRTTNQDREGGFCILELKDGATTIWRYQFPEYPTWGDGHSQPFAFDNINVNAPAAPQFLITLTQAGARERNILWRFEAKAEFRTDRGNTIRFDQTGLSLRCGDGGPATVSTPVNRLN